MHNLPHYQYPPPEGKFVTTDAPTLTDDNQPKSVVYITFHYWCCTFYWFVQMHNDSIHHYRIIQSIFSALKNPLCCMYSSLPPIPRRHWFFYCLHTLEYHIVDIKQYVSFQIGFFHFVICIYIFSMSFHKSAAHFFSALNNIPLSGCTRVYLSIHLLMDNLIASKFW